MATLTPSTGGRIFPFRRINLTGLAAGSRRGDLVLNVATGVTDPNLSRQPSLNAWLVALFIVRIEVAASRISSRDEGFTLKCQLAICRPFNRLSS